MRECTKCAYTHHLATHRAFVCEHCGHENEARGRFGDWPEVHGSETG